MCIEGADVCPTSGDLVRLCGVLNIFRKLIMTNAHWMVTCLLFLGLRCFPFANHPHYYSVSQQGFHI